MSPLRIRPSCFVAAVLAASLSSTSVPASAGPASSPEFRYVFEDDAAAAEKLLDPLLKKYATPAKCADLLKILRKPSFPAAAKDKETLDWTCPDGKSRQFTYVLPKKYAPGKPAGVLIFLHGAISQPAPGGGANEASRIAMPAVADLDFIVIGPSTYEKVEWGDPACRALVRHALDYVKRNFNVDENRVFVAGDSDGGRGTYRIAEAEAGALAGAVPIIGSPGGVSRFANFRNLPFFAINGENDSIFKIDGVREAVDGMKASGIDLTWKLVEKGSHDPFYFVKFKDEICAFLTKHRREPFSKTVHWQLDPADGDVALANTCRWIRIDSAGSTTNKTDFEDASKGLLRADLPRIEAKYEGNKVELRTSGVKDCTVLVSPDMLDLKQDVEVRANGVLAFQGKVEPDARVILEEARRLRDRTMLFVGRIAVDVDAPPFVPAPPAGK